MTETRHQLSLFVSPKNEPIEKIRAEFNPLQYNLIPAHITLCREDEIETIDEIVEQINSIKISKPMLIKLNGAERFAEGKGAWLTAKDDNIEFIKLRQSVLGQSEFQKIHHPHITLMHPRNSTCTEIFYKIKKAALPTELSFDTICLIEQKNGGKWNILKKIVLVQTHI